MTQPKKHHLSEQRMRGASLGPVSIGQEGTTWKFLSGIPPEISCLECTSDGAPLALHSHWSMNSACEPFPASTSGCQRPACQSALPSGEFCDCASSLGSQSKSVLTVTVLPAKWTLNNNVKQYLRQYLRKKINHNRKGQNSINYPRNDVVCLGSRIEIHQCSIHRWGGGLPCHSAWSDSSCPLHHWTWRRAVENQTLQGHRPSAICWRSSLRL